MKLHAFAITLILFAHAVSGHAENPLPEPPEGVALERDVSFLAAERGEKLDLYTPAEREKGRRYPAVVIIHGGGWVKGDKGREREFVTGTTLAKAGYICVSINYETRRSHRWPTNLHDCKNAVRWLRVNADRLGVDPDRIGVIGGSAGGHLALMVAYTGDDPVLSSDELYPGVSDRVSACVDMYGITNLLTRQTTSDDGTPDGGEKGHRLFPEGRDEAPEKWRLASPVSYVRKVSPPTLILHGTADTTVDREQSEELHRTLQSAGAESTLRLIEGAKHAWPLRTKKFDLTGEVVGFFDQHLKDGASTKQKPNVLFISVDDLNDWDGALGGHPLAKTPNIDRLAAQGCLFTNAHCSQAVCNASRNSLLSGIHPSTSGWYGSTKAMRATYNEVMGEHKMLPEHFRDSGYHTLAAGKVFHQGVSDYKDRTDDFWDETAPTYKVPKKLLARGDGYGGKQFYPFPKEGSAITRHYGMEFENGNSLCAGPLDREDMPGGKMFDELIADWAVDKLSDNHKKPFFMAVGFVRPHVPFTAPREYFDLYDFDEIRPPHIPLDEMSDIPLMGKSIAYGTIKTGDHYAVTHLRDTYWRELIHGYLACVSFVDAQIGRVLDALEKSEHSKDTIVVLWSDHGQHLGEKQHWRKQSLWEEATRVPLIFKVPSLSMAGQRPAGAVSLLDVYPTLVDLCGLPAAEKLGGVSLVPLLKDSHASRGRPVLSSWYYGNYAVRSERWRYIRYRDGTTELYDHSKDPGEHTNLAAAPEYAPIIAEHQKWIPKEGKLPPGQEFWKGDKLDRRIADWESEGGVPEWLR